VFRVLIALAAADVPASCEQHVLRPTPQVERVFPVLREGFSDIGLHLLPQFPDPYGRRGAGL
jgi:hypothetical protein